MAEFKNLDIGKIGLIQQLEDGRIIQIGLTKDQSELLQYFLGNLSKETLLVKMGDDYELVLKNSLLN